MQDFSRNVYYVYIIYEYDERSSNNAVAVATRAALLLVRGSRCDIFGGKEGDKSIHW